MSAPEKENLNGELENAEETVNAAVEENEVPSDSELPEIPQEADEVAVAAGDEAEAEEPARDKAEEPAKKRAAVIVSADEVAKSKVAEKRRVAAEAEKKKKRNSLILKICLPIVVVAFLALAFFESSLFYRVTPAVKVGNTTYSVAEFNYFYTNSFSEIYSSMQSSYGDYMSYIVDTSKPLKDQQYSDTQTWEDYVKERAIETMRNMTALCESGEAAGFALPDDVKATVESSVASLETYAAAYGYTADSMLAQMYGRGMNKSLYSKMLEKTYYASAYSEDISYNPEPTTEEIDARYAEDVNDFDTVTFRYFYLSASAAEGEDAAHALKETRAAAEKMAAAKTEKEFTDLAVENTAEDLREGYDAEYSTLANSISYANVNSGYADWMFDAARKAGDTTTYDNTASDGTVNGVYVLYFVSRSDIRYNTVNVRHILISPEQDADGNVSTAAKAAAEAKAENVLKQWSEGGGTEEAFIALVADNSADTGSSSNGGLYENVYKNQMVAEFNNWCFDSARKPGDTDIVETSYGYHVMYFVGEGESYFTKTVRDTIGTERYTAWLEENLGKFTETQLSGFKYCCNK